MATELSRGNLFDPVLVKDLISKVKGKSSLAVLSAQTPIPFNGRKEFTFTMDSEIDVVAENGKKTHGGITLDPVTIVPIKVEYGARISDEFLYASEEEQLDILKSFNDGFAKKLASGLDIMAFHGLNPRTGEASAVIGGNHFDSKVTQTVTYAAATPDANIETAIALVEGSDGDVSGMAIAPAVRSALAAMTKQNGEKLYPEFAFGGKPANLGAHTLDINKTVATVTLTMQSLVTLQTCLNGVTQKKFQWKSLNMVIQTTLEKTLRVITRYISVLKHILAGVS